MQIDLKKVLDILLRESSNARSEISDKENVRRYDLARHDYLSGRISTLNDIRDILDSEDLSLVQAEPYNERTELERRILEYENQKTISKG